nr:MAG TPA_asm: hypothetical protein [Caudoviricetes sp.]
MIIMLGFGLVDLLVGLATGVGYEIVRILF